MTRIIDRANPCGLFRLELYRQRDAVNSGSINFNIFADWLSAAGLRGEWAHVVEENEGAHAALSEARQEAPHRQTDYSDTCTGKFWLLAARTTCRFSSHWAARLIRTWHSKTVTDQTSSTVWKI